MVEKTRRSVSVLRRCQESDREELNYWRRRSGPHDDRKTSAAPGSVPFSKTHSPLSTDPVHTGEFHNQILYIRTTNESFTLEKIITFQDCNLGL